MMKRFALLLLAGMLAGCASMPLSTIWRFMQLTPQDIVLLDPSELGVAVQLPDALTLNDEGATLDVALFQREGDVEQLVLEERAHLETVEVGRQVIAPLATASVGRHWHVLRLPAQAQESFRRFQKNFDAFWAEEGDKYFRVTVNPKFADEDSLAGAHLITIALRLSAEDGWFVMLKNAEFDFDELRRQGAGTETD